MLCKGEDVSLSSKRMMQSKQTGRDGQLGERVRQWSSIVHLFHFDDGDGVYRDEDVVMIDGTQMEGGGAAYP